MSDPVTMIYDALVVGGGHAGLSMSYHLQKNNLSHLVFEKGKTGESWRAQRWDSFALNTPNHLSILPGDEYTGNRPEGFFSAPEFVGMLEQYVHKFGLPVREGVRVISVEPDAGLFVVRVLENGAEQTYSCRQIVIASGCQNQRQVPALSTEIPDGILQLHTMDYKNAAQLPPGKVLVVGSAQSGCQIAEDLLAAGREVLLSTSLVARLPRRYRGKDVVDWLNGMRFFDLPTDQVSDPQMFRARQPQVSGVGEYGKTVSLQQLADDGVVLLGNLKGVAGSRLIFENNAAQHVRFADEFSQKIKDMIDDFIRQNGVSAPPPERDPADEPDRDCHCVPGLESLDLREQNITSIIWTTGFCGDFSFLPAEMLNGSGLPRHHNGIGEIPGMYFLGLPWLRKRKSGIVLGIADDAEYIAGCILNYESE